MVDVVDHSKRALMRGKLFSRSPDVTADPHIRLPWVKEPQHFTNQCTRCNDCITACPEHILVHDNGGFPEISFATDGCTFCNACTDACQSVSFLTEKTQHNAWALTLLVDDTCLNHQQVYCRSCKDSCAEDAISFPLSAGLFGKPVINTHVCTSCGACAAPCPASSISLIQSVSLMTGTPL